MQRTLSLIFALGFLVASALPVLAQNEQQQIRQKLEQRDRQIKQVLGDRATFSDTQRDQLRDLINGSIDFEAMARHALGPHWSEINTSQRRDFVDVFGDVVRAQSLSNVDIYRSSVRYDDISVSGNEAKVTTTTTYKNTPTPVVYEMHKQDGDWMITDIILDGTSTAQGYANSFQRVFKRHGYDRLMESLRKRAARS